MDKLWIQTNIELERLNALAQDTMAFWMEIQFIDVGADYIKATMPVKPATHQPFGLLHGGASAALAETIGSVASWLCIDPAKYFAVGLEINCNHIRGKKNGYVTATARPLHIGKTTHVWDIKIEDERGKLVCISRLTMAIRKNEVVS